MKISKNGINLIKRFEGVRLKAYKADPSEKKWTIGYGHYGVEAGLTITQAEAEEYLVKDLAKYEKKVNKYLSKYNFNQNQFDALVSFAFNIGSIDQLTANGTRNFAMISMKMLEYKIHITKRSINARREFNNYTWRQDKEGKWLNEPIDMYNHIVDSLRYVCLTKLLGDYGSGMQAADILGLMG